MKNFTATVALIFIIFGAATFLSWLLSVTLDRAVLYFLVGAFSGLAVDVASK
jgi:hypothetical protein